MNYNHNTVIHKDHFVDPQTGAHINWIKNFWSHLKYQLKLVKGSLRRMTDGHTDEFLYRFNRKGEGDFFELLMSDIARYYLI